MDVVDNQDRQRAWSSFWEAGALHSCQGSFADDYAGAIGDFWQARFAHLSDQSRVLDIATGNGALPRLLWQREPALRPKQIDAVDLAAVAPRWWKPDVHTGIAFHSGKRAEQLPFADASYDLVISQFGLEYATWPHALDEAIRVCQRDGQLAFVMHHADSVIVNVGLSELSHQRALLADDGLLAAALSILPWLEKARSGDPAAGSPPAHEARSRYNAAMRHLAVLIEKSEFPDLLIEARERIHGTMAGAFGNQSSLQQRLLTEFGQSLSDAMVRTREMLDCALDSNMASTLAESLRQRVDGRAVDYRPLSQKEGLLAWGIVVA